MYFVYLVEINKKTVKVGYTRQLRLRTMALKSRLIAYIPFKERLPAKQTEMRLHNLIDPWRKSEFYKKDVKIHNLFMGQKKVVICL